MGRATRRAAIVLYCKDASVPARWAASWRAVVMELKKPIPGDQLIGLGAIVLFLVSFFHWLGAVGTIRSGEAAGALSGSAWGFTLTTFAVLLGLALLGYVILRVVDVDLPTKIGSATLGQVVLGVAGAAFVLVFIKLLAGPNVSTIPSTVAGLPVTVTKTRNFGIYAGLVATGALAVGAFLSLQAEQLSGS